MRDQQLHEVPKAPHAHGGGKSRAWCPFPRRGWRLSGSALLPETIRARAVAIARVLSNAMSHDKRSPGGAFWVGSRSVQSPLERQRKISQDSALMKNIKVVVTKSKGDTAHQGSEAWRARVHGNADPNPTLLDAT
ncbi:hypothetical protein N9M16_07240 [Candidatus Dependentiae bacterium]|nr:hypothetical protein [Candidatus Dependentiae bacterium]